MVRDFLFLWHWLLIDFNVIRNCIQKFVMLRIPSRNCMLSFTLLTGNILIFYKNVITLNHYCREHILLFVFRTVFYETASIRSLHCNWKHCPEPYMVRHLDRTWWSRMSNKQKVTSLQVYKYLLQMRGNVNIIVLLPLL